MAAQLLPQSCWITPQFQLRPLTSAILGTLPIAAQSFQMPGWRGHGMASSVPGFVACLMVSAAQLENSCVIVSEALWKPADRYQHQRYCQL